MPQKTVHLGTRTGQWQNDQQKNFRKGLLPRDRAGRMQEIHHGVFENQIDRVWEENYRACADYLRENPDSRLTHSTVYMGRRIGTWIRNQVAAMNRGALRGERLARLAALDGRFVRPSPAQSLAVKNAAGPRDPPHLCGPFTPGRVPGIFTSSIGLRIIVG
jgi:hypothetical protein